jgi:thiol-disulfide isomerase/thioredoxin
MVIKVGFFIWLMVLVLGLLTHYRSILEGNEKGMEFKISQNHKVLTQEADWLNTSRLLVAQDFIGRVLLVDFWTYCCINCMHVIPKLNELEKEFGDSLTVIGVHSAKFVNERERENISNAIIRYDIKHPVVNDAHFKIWKAFGVSAWPTLILINPEGNIETTFSGEGNLRVMRDAIKKLLKKYSVISDPLPIKLERDKQPKTALSFPSKLLYVDNFDTKPALFISDSGNNRIVGVRMNGEMVITIGSGIAGYQDGSFETAQFSKPQGIAYKNNVLYVADTVNHRLRKIDFETKMVTTLAGTGERGSPLRSQSVDALPTALASPWDVALYPDDTHLVIAMAGTHQLWSYQIKNKQFSVLAGNGREFIDDGSLPYNSLSQPSGLSARNGKLYFVDSETSSLRLFFEGEVTTLIGTGLFDFGYEEGSRDHARMQHPLGLYADDDSIYIADTYNHAIRKYDLGKHELFNVSGNGKTGSRVGSLQETQFNEPNDIIKIKSKFYVADTNNHRIVILDVEQNKAEIMSFTQNVSTSKSERELSDDLPQVQKALFISVPADKKIRLSIRLPKGYKLNDSAPSWIALFDVTDKPVMIKEYTKDEAKTLSCHLPQLTPGRLYRLQATFYYCEQSQGAACLIMSYDQELRVNEYGGQNSIEIKIDIS